MVTRVNKVGIKNKARLEVELETELDNDLWSLVTHRYNDTCYGL